MRALVTGHWNKQSWEMLISNLRVYIADAPVQVDFVDSIPLLKTGKRTPVVSHLKIDFQKINQS